MPTVYMKRCAAGKTRKNGRCVKSSSTLARRKAPRKAKRCAPGTRRNKSGRCVAPRRKRTYRARSYAPRRQYAPIMYAPDYNYGNNQLALQAAAFKAPTAFHLKDEARLRREQPEYWARRDAEAKVEEAKEAEAKLRAASAQAKLRAASAQAKLKLANVQPAAAALVAAAVARRSPPGMGAKRHNFMNFVR